MLPWFWARRPRSSEQSERSTHQNMSQASSTSLPALTPQFCFNQTLLRDFLRISRSTIDDSITQNLNALINPASAGFDPSSTATRQVTAADRRRVDPRTCDSFKNNILFPSWQTRSDVLAYCARVATSSDPDDPDLLLRQIESVKERERVVNERLDPYSARYFPREARTEALANLIRNERSVEEIIRSRTWSAISERCDISGKWEDAFNQWLGKGSED